MNWAGPACTTSVAAIVERSRTVLGATSPKPSASLGLTAAGVAVACASLALLVMRAAPEEELDRCAATVDQRRLERFRCPHFILHEPTANLTSHAGSRTLHDSGRSSDLGGLGGVGSMLTAHTYALKHSVGSAECAELPVVTCGGCRRTDDVVGDEHCSVGCSVDGASDGVCARTSLNCSPTSPPLRATVCSAAAAPLGTSSMQTSCSWSKSAPSQERDGPSGTTTSLRASEHTQQHLGSPPTVLVHKQGHVQRARTSAPVSLSWPSSASASGFVLAAQRQGQVHPEGRGVWISMTAPGSGMGGGASNGRGRGTAAHAFSNRECSLPRLPSYVRRVFLSAPASSGWGAVAAGLEGPCC